MNVREKQALLKAALGEQKAELVLKNAHIVDVLTGTCYGGDIAISKGIILGVGDYRGEREVDLGGKYVAPGWIDAHVHIESSMVSPRIFAEKVLPTGTTAIIADPHELVNVAGKWGVSYFLQEAQGAAADLFLMLPSCVPLNQNDHNGAVYGVADMAEAAEEPRVLGLGEAMNVGAVAGGEAEMLAKLALFERKTVDGHAPLAAGKLLQAYALAGVQSDHECATFGEALEKLRAGLFVQVREGSAAKNLEAILSGALEAGISLERFVFCSDDKHLEDIDTLGHMDHNIRKAIALGVSPVEAIAMATIRPARLYGLRNRGAVAAGYGADLVVLDDLRTVAVADVYKNGVSLGERTPAKPTQVPAALFNTVHIPPFTEKKLRLPVTGLFPVIRLQPNQIATKRRDVELQTQAGLFVPYGDFLKVAVVQRHDGSGRTMVGAVEGFGLKNGAIAGTVAHDAHNLIVIGDNDRDMALAVQTLIDSGGGYALTSGGALKAALSLPIAGLFTDRNTETLVREIHELIALGRAMGIPEEIDPLLNLSFLSLPVIPELRITDSGIFDVCSETFLKKEGESEAALEAAPRKEGETR